MTATYMLRKHQRALEAMKTPEAVERRSREIQAGERAARDLRERFPEVTPENFLDADSFHKERLHHWNTHFGLLS